LRDKYFVKKTINAKIFHKLCKSYPQATINIHAVKRRFMQEFKVKNKKLFAKSLALLGYCPFGF
jgi:hypothetical protein